MVRKLGMVMLSIALVMIFVSPICAQDTPLLPLAEPGIYDVGTRIQSLSFVDATRNGRKIDLALWYPAIPPENPDQKVLALHPPGEWGWPNATPNVQGAPYPLILDSHGYRGSNLDLYQLKVLLASHGYVVVGLSHPNNDLQTTLVDRPLDVLFALDQLAAITTGDLAGLIDTQHVGVMGLSDGAYTALAVTGTRIDPASASAWGARPMIPGDQTDPRSAWKDWNWDELAAYRARISPLKAGAMWPPFTDPRIKAALMFAPCNTPLFGDNGLAAAAVPALIVAGTNDRYCPYDHDATYAYAHLGSQDRYLLTVINGGHGLVTERRFLPVGAQFAGAFFGDYLQGNQDDAQYLTSDYVDRVAAQLKRGLVWGPYTAN